MSLTEYRMPSLKDKHRALELKGVDAKSQIDEVTAEPEKLPVKVKGRKKSKDKKK